MPSLLIVGANSDMAKAVAARYAQAGFGLQLASRDVVGLQKTAHDLQIRFDVPVEVFGFDITHLDSHRPFYEGLSEKPVGVVCAVGVMPDQKIAQEEWVVLMNVLTINFTACAAFLEVVAADFEARKTGFIVGISSVAGDRGRQSNYIYGSAKAGFSAYLSGLRNRLAQVGVPVLTVKPGFVATKMTAGLRLPKWLTATPEAVAEAVFNAQKQGRDVLYVKPIWRWIMAIITRIPERQFKGMKL
ncbi:MAG: SDR family oxidoreductase [Candidatus Margulisiibacteriota bacterium]